MIEGERVDFLQTLQVVAEMHGKTLSPPELKLWWQVMRDGWTLAEFRQAAAYLLKTSKWFPKPAEFFELRDGAKANPADAWSVVIEHARGAWRRLPSCGDRIADQVVQSLGGWYALAMSTDRDLSFRRRDFVDTYRDMAERDQVAAALPDLRPAANGSRRLGGMAKVGELVTLAPQPGGNKPSTASDAGAGSTFSTNGKTR